MIYYILPVLMHALLSEATLEVQTGLLHRLVQFYKNSFLNDLISVAPVKVEVSIEPEPPGYEDSTAWDYDSVIRLLELLRASDSAPARKLHRELTPLTEVPSRRYLGMGRLHKARQLIKRRMMRCAGNPKRPGYPKNCPKKKQPIRRARARARKHQKQKSQKYQNFQKYPSRKDLNRLYIPNFYNPNDIYYDEMLSVEEMKLEPEIPSAERGNSSLNDDEILVISNPVEAKLPSGHISIGMLRRILEARAEAARVMPTRPPPTTDTTKEKQGDETTADDATTGDGSSNTTSAAGDDTTVQEDETGGTAATGSTGASDGTDAVTDGTSPSTDDGNKEEGKEEGNEEGKDEEKPEGEEEKNEGEEEKPAEDENPPE
ncbi:uncharacterized protein LOC128681744 [Plodia interpunctella]|uniref:uncharacterized protein LOC128681744 n=1 Tax=Plodia interpunctella TaxID=58824 RepID=UPI0023681E32|nr:uncharacterized protein LOC128681744 [Plodia interpunctella]XP_053621854.1 uncharacterized protein LOC128681744 [Plodia interpunctella]XP_053621856.1 uncharacterized protein LOC128681744 [Plodia interpunctella]XP_053621857.1 uncharacterized protein LOC128681744 [Plodia interpunctella]